MPTQPGSDARAVEAPAQGLPAVRTLAWLLLLLVPPALLLSLWTPPAALQQYVRQPRAHAWALPPAHPRVVAAAGCTNSSRPPAQWAMANEQPPCLVRPTVLLFGDSLTERSMDPDGGWGAALAHHFSRKVDVTNRGYGGYNSRWGLKLLHQVLAQTDGRRVALMTIWFGANDAALPDASAARQHVPPGEYAANLGAMVTAARAAGITHILLLTPPPVDADARVKHVMAREGLSTPVPPDRTLAASATYAAAVTELGARMGVPTLDMHAALQAHPRWRQELLSDGLHFTPAGSRAVWAAVRAAILQHFPHLSLERMSNHMPWWDKWDAADPEAYWAATLPVLQQRETEQQTQQQQQRASQQQKQQQTGGG